MANTHALDNDPAMSRDQGSTKDIAVDGGPEDGKTHQFNEQTNYVPQRAIITVSYYKPSIRVVTGLT